jgi:hypothetical protein
MTYKKQFDLNPSDIDLIETCLRKELHIRSENCQCECCQCRRLAKQENAEDMGSAEQGISEITELLGKIHNQKIWYDGDPAKPWMPKG